MTDKMTDKMNPPSCEICKQPLGDSEISQRWHAECEKCTICNHPLSVGTVVVEKCLAANSPIAHSVCSSKIAIEQIRTETIPVTIKHVQALNDCILAMRHTVAPPTSDIDLLSNALRALQECAANVSWVLKQTRDKISIEDSQEYAEKVKVERKQRAADSEVTSIREQKTAERIAQLTAERENPELRNRRKALEGIMKTFGFSLEAATAMLDKQNSPKIQ